MLLPCDARIKSELDNIGVDCFSAFAKNVFKASGKNTLQTDKKRAFIPNHLIADVSPKSAARIHEHCQQACCSCDVCSDRNRRLQKSSSSQQWRSHFYS